MHLITKLFVSKKLEGIIPELFITKDSVLDDNPLGKWNATLFYISRKKCLLITNSQTRYSVILAGVAASDFKAITDLFVSTFTKQLQRDGILVDGLNISNLVGELSFSRSDNDKRTIGVQNHMLIAIEDWKEDFGDYENWDFYEIGKRLNSTPYEFVVAQSGSGKRMLSKPSVKMGKVVSDIFSTL